MARTRARRRKRQLATYGLTAADYDLLLSFQGGVCACCSNPGPSDRGGRLPVDHDHTTGRVRGIVCSRCNSALGHALDDPTRLRLLANYLERHATATP